MLLVTKTLLFTVEGLRGESELRALDKATGRVVWKTKVPGIVSSVPMSFAINGKQFVEFWVGDSTGRTPAELLAFAVTGS